MGSNNFCTARTTSVPIFLALLYPTSKAKRVAQMLFPFVDFTRSYALQTGPIYACTKTTKAAVGSFAIIALANTHHSHDNEYNELHHKTGKWPTKAHSLGNTAYPLLSGGVQGDHNQQHHLIRGYTVRINTLHTCIFKKDTLTSFSQLRILCMI